MTFYAWFSFWCLGYFIYEGYLFITTHNGWYLVGALVYLVFLVWSIKKHYQEKSKA